MDRYTFPSEQNCPTTTERYVSDGAGFGDMLHVLARSPRLTHLVLQVNAQATVKAEGSQGRRFSEVLRFPIW